MKEQTEELIYEIRKSSLAKTTRRTLAITIPRSEDPTMATNANSPQVFCIFCNMNGNGYNEFELVILGCSHVFCVDCVNALYNNPMSDGGGRPIRGTFTTTCPICKQNTLRPIAIALGPKSGFIDGKVVRQMVPRQVRASQPKAGIFKGVVLDCRLYTELWGDKYKPHSL